MKALLHRFLKYCTTLLVLLLLVTNCEKDEHPHFDSSFIEESQNVFDSKTVSIDDVPALKGLLQKTGKSTIGRTTELSCGTIDLDHILQVTHLEDEQTNYSFYLSHQTEDSSAALYNYVITDHNDGTYGELIFEYIPDEAFLSQYSEYTQEAIANFTGQLNIYPYADFCSSSSSKSSSTALPCPNTGGVISGNSSGGPDTSGNNNDNEGSDGTVGGSGGGGGGSWCTAFFRSALHCDNPPHNASCYTTVITWVCHAVARSSSAKTEQDCLDIDFAGIVPYDAIRNVRECLGDLATDEQLAFLKNSDNYSVVKVLSGFIDQNGCSEEMQNYLIEAIETVMNGGEVPCPEGYIKDKDGNCVEQPCPGNPVPNPEIAPQYGASGERGAMFGNENVGGCTRYGEAHCNTPRNKRHNGIDIKNEINSPVHVMHSGFIYSSGYSKDFGYYATIQSTMNEETVLITYAHMQKENRIEQGPPGSALVQVSAGQILGYQGDTGNIKDALDDGTVDPHVHIEVQKHDGSNKWGTNNFDLVDPRDYFSTTIYPNGQTQANPDCN